METLSFSTLLLADATEKLEPRFLADEERTKELEPYELWKVVSPSEEGFR